MKKRSQWYANLASGLLGFFLPTLFAWKVYQSHAPQSIATWGMFFALDGLGLILVIKNKNDEPYLQIGWTVAAFCVLLGAMMGGSSLIWGTTEIVSLTFCGLAIFLWLTKSARIALWAFPVAMVTSFVPLIKDYWYHPQPETAWLWHWTMICCALSIYGAKKKDLSSVLVPGVCFIMNGIVALLCDL